MSTKNTRQTPMVTRKRARENSLRLHNTPDNTSVVSPSDRFRPDLAIAELQALPQVMAWDAEKLMFVRVESSESEPSAGESSKRHKARSRRCGREVRKRRARKTSSSATTTASSATTTPETALQQATTVSSIASVPELDMLPSEMLADSTSVQVTSPVTGRVLSFQVKPRGTSPPSLTAPKKTTRTRSALSRSKVQEPTVIQRPVPTLTERKPTVMTRIDQSATIAGRNGLYFKFDPVISEIVMYRGNPDENPLLQPVRVDASRMTLAEMDETLEQVNTVIVPCAEMHGVYAKLLIEHTETLSQLRDKAAEQLLFAEQIRETARKDEIAAHESVMRTLAGRSIQSVPSTVRSNMEATKTKARIEKDVSLAVANGTEHTAKEDLAVGMRIAEKALYDKCQAAFDEKFAKAPLSARPLINQLVGEISIGLFSWKNIDGVLS